jgi:hypothetical protein
MIEKTHPRPSVRVESPQRATADQQKRAPARAPEQQVEVAATSSGDKQRIDEQTAKVANYQSKTAADRLEGLNMADIVLTAQNELNAISGVRRPDGAGSGGLQQPKKAGQ